ncbi:MAG: hypothetical protein KME64_24340 [Scytonematopsis contorta HA4267-MV1]|jgi:hypothetical protein|nr:hypothetical protein [Scytonematopsis contorta HA4267-MV1]
MSNYQQLTEAKLRNYVKQHPNDEEAFQHYLTIVRARPGIVVSTGEQLEEELKKRIEAESKP